MILIVDDHIDISAALRRLLRWDGYNVEIANSGHDALVWLRVNRPRLILLDYMMPDMTGVEVLKQALREGLITAERVLFYTAAPEKVVPQIATLGVGGCIAKGTDWEEMSVTIARHMLLAGAIGPADKNTTGQHAPV